jgi:hypothetical protein
MLRDFRDRGSLCAAELYDESTERDGRGNPASQWETDRVLVLRPVGAKPAVWPEADFIVGNRPFIAGKDLRAELGCGAGSWREAWRAEAVWFHLNSIRQTFSRRVIAEALEGKRRLHLVFAIPNHSWADGEINADLTVGVDVTSVLPLRATEGLCSRGTALHGAGFIVSRHLPAA